MRISDWSSDVCSSDLVGLYVSVNSAGRDGAAGAIRSALFDQFADRYFPPEQPAQAQRVDAQTAAEHARMMVGTYTNSRRADSSFFKALGLVGQMKRSEEHTSELQSLMRISYAVFCLKQKMHQI